MYGLRCAPGPTLLDKNRDWTFVECVRRIHRQDLVLQLSRAPIQDSLARRQKRLLERRTRQGVQELTFSHRGHGDSK